jgi:DNA polymerase-3 subunit chi
VADRLETPAPAAVGAQATRVDFYVIDEASPAQRLRLACRVAEKAYLANQSVLIWHTDAQELKSLDDMLWTFSDRSFVPHEMLAAPGTREAPVVLSAGTTPALSIDLIINLASEVPPFLDQARRIAEIIDGDETRRLAGRARWSAYRERGLQPTHHSIRSGE